MSESPSTDDDLVLTLAGNAFDVLIVALGMAVLALLLWMVYRTMQHPRLPVVRTADRAPAVTWPGALRYLLTTPPMVGFWFGIILFLLAAAAGERTPGDVLIAATAVVGGARLLAHFNEEIAHELAKTVPITILGFIIIGGGFAGSDRFSQVWEGLPVDTFDTYWWGLIGFDVLITAAWFGGQRLHWHWVRHRREAGLPIENPLTRLWNRWRAVGYRSTSKESS